MTIKLKHGRRWGIFNAINISILLFCTKNFKGKLTMKNCRLFLLLMCFIASPLWAGTFEELISDSTGKTYVVSTESEFNQRAASAQPGDVILVADGTYSGWQLKIPSVGTNDKPIIYTAQNQGQVTFQGGVKLFWLTGNYNVVGGFNINNVDQDVILFHSGASYNRITDNKMHSIGGNGSSRGYINFREQSHYNRIDHNEVTEAEDAIRIWLDEDAIDNGPSQYTCIDHNSFKDTTPGGTSRCVLQIGQGDAILETHTLFEHNYIENHFTGYNEVISIKSCYNIIRDNEIKDAYGSISLRWGDYNEVYNNYIHGSGTGRAISIKGAYHKVYNNVIDAPGKTGIKMDRWGHRNYLKKDISEIPPTHDNIIAYNTIIDYDDRAMRIGDIYGEACRPIYNCKVFNNIIIGDGGDLFHSNTDSYQSGDSRCDERDWDELGGGYNDIEISNNLFFKTGTASYGSGYDLDKNKVVGNPNLIDIFHLPSGSIAIDKGIVIPSISVDCYGNPRDGAPDTGAFEYSKVLLPPENVEAIKQ